MRLGIVVAPPQAGGLARIQIIDVGGLDIDRRIVFDRVRLHGASIVATGAAHVNGYVRQTSTPCSGVTSEAEHGRPHHLGAQQLPSGPLHRDLALEEQVGA